MIRTNFSIFLLVLFVSFSVFAKNKRPPASAMYLAKSSVQKHFDANQDGYLSRLEFERLRTHMMFGFPLAKSLAERAYDFNQNGMLEESEQAKMQRDKQSGQYKKFVKAYKKKKKNAILNVKVY